uniref:Uncharacterized protein n=1 Tax=Spermophilus dauricus TaxID=99837 RepID=A0A8C9PDU2_SPEDA
MQLRYIADSMDYREPQE